MSVKIRCLRLCCALLLVVLLFCGCGGEEPAAGPLQDLVPTLQVTKVDLGVPFYVQASDGGSRSYIIEEVPDNDGNVSGVLWHEDGKLDVFPWCSYLTDAYLVTGHATPMLLVCADEMSDDFAVAVCMLRSSGPAVVGVHAGRIGAVHASSGRVQLYEHVDALGSWMTERWFDLHANGSLTVAGDGLYKIIGSGERPLEVAWEISADIMHNGVWTKETLPCGTRLFPHTTDGDTHMLFTLGDGREGRICFQKVDGETLVDGLNDWEVFYNVLYAG